MTATILYECGEIGHLYVENDGFDSKNAYMWFPNVKTVGL